MDDIEREIVILCEAGRHGCLARLVASTGSVPMSRRARMLVRDDGSSVGTVGGGAIEARVLAAAPEVIRESRPRLLRCTLREDEATSLGMVCGGTAELFLEPVAGSQAAELHRAIGALQEAQGRGVLATLLDAGGQARLAPGASLLVRADGSSLGSFGDSALNAAVAAEAPAALGRDKGCVAAFDPSAGALSGDTPGAPRVFLDPIGPAPTVILFGAGHVGLYTAQVAALAGLRVVVVDDRAEFASRERFPQADEVLEAGIEEAFDRLRVDESAYVVAVTRGHQHDLDVVARALRTPARYVGMIGSRRKVAVIRAALRERGLSDEEIARLRAPIGLPIGADTPEEIAVSIVGEIIAVRRGAT